MGVAKLCVLVMTAIHTACCVDIRDMFPFGDPNIDSRLIGGDQSSDPLNIAPFKYFGVSHTSLFVNTNGALSFGSKASSNILTQENLPKSSGTPPIIAPFWNGIKIRQIAGWLWYRQSTDPVLLRKASYEICDSFIPAWIFVATWHEVRFFGAYGHGKVRKNTFQVVIANDETLVKSYVIFNYNKLEWDSSVANGGGAETGLGGTSPAIAGFESGDGSNFVELPGSFTTDVRHLASKSNVGVPGKWIFNIENRPVKVPRGPCPPADDCNKCRNHLAYDPVCGTNDYTYFSRCVLESSNCLNKETITVNYDGKCPRNSVNYAAARGDRKLQPHAMLLSAALGQCHVIHYM